MKNKVFIVAMIAIVMVLMLKFVENNNLKTSNTFGAATIYTDNKSFVDRASGANGTESKWFVQVVTLIAAAVITNEEVAVFTVGGSASNLQKNTKATQNIAMANLD